jgi:hypothetical protein
MNMSSTPISMDENEQASVSSNELPDLSTMTISTPILPPQILTENEYEDNLMELIDQMIYRFLNRPNRRSPYRTIFRWTFDDEPHLSYSVIVKIEAPSSLI